MKRTLALFLLLSLAISGIPLHGQERSLPVWPTVIPGAKASPSYAEVKVSAGTNSEWVHHVSMPTIEVFPAPQAKATGTAVIICPGGGYGGLAFKKEGVDIAHWLNDAGIAGIVLKYRLPNDTIMEKKTVGPLQDVQEAVRIVRRHAAEWGIDPHKIGVMGFSAGGHLASTSATHYGDRVYDADTTSARPDFSLLIYPVVSMDASITHAGTRSHLLGTSPDQHTIDFYSNELQVDEHTPPAFLVHAENDKAVPVENSIKYFLALKAHNVPAELHLYETGGHGFALTHETGTEAHWPAACLEWMRSRGLR